MIPEKFDYHRAATVDDAIRLLKQHGDEAKILAGGHSLVPAMKLRLSYPSLLVDIGRIPELNYIREDGDEIAIGAATTHRQMEDSKLIAKEIPMMSQSAAVIGDGQVRNRGTIGGSIAHADPAADWPASILAAEGTIVVKGTGGERRIAADDFFQGLYMTALGENEIVTEIRVKKDPSGGGSSYRKFMQPASRFAIVGCAAVVADGGKYMRVAFTGVADHAFRDKALESALSGGNITVEAELDAALAKAAQGVDVLSDHFASEEYRLHLAKVYAKRALLAAIQ